MFTKQFKTMLRHFMANYNEGLDSIKYSNGHVKEDYSISSHPTCSYSPPSNDNVRDAQKELVNKNISEYSYAYMYPLVICIGTGSTPPTVDDYSLENPCNLNGDYTILTINNSIGSNNSDVNSITLTVTPSTTSGPVTVRELGLFTNDARYYTPILLCREVLDNDIVINIGESKSFTMSIDFNNFIG